MKRKLSRWLNQQLTVLRFWWRKPASGTFDITPATPARKVWGTHMNSRNGSFRPTLMDVVTGKARAVMFPLSSRRSK